MKHLRCSFCVGWNSCTPLVSVASEPPSASSGSTQCKIHADVFQLVLQNRKHASQVKKSLCIVHGCQGRDPVFGQRLRLTPVFPSNHLPTFPGFFFSTLRQGTSKTRPTASWCLTWPPKQEEHLFRCPYLKEHKTLRLMCFNEITTLLWMQLQSYWTLHVRILSVKLQSVFSVTTVIHAKQCICWQKAMCRREVNKIEALQSCI